MGSSGTEEHEPVKLRKSTIFVDQSDCRVILRRVIPRIENVDKMPKVILRLNL